MIDRAVDDEVEDDCWEENFDTKVLGTEGSLLAVTIVGEGGTSSNCSNIFRYDEGFTGVGDVLNRLIGCSDRILRSETEGIRRDICLVDI